MFDLQTPTHEDNEADRKGLLRGLIVASLAVAVLWGLIIGALAWGL